MAEDGSVVIGVKLDTAKADKELARMNQKIENLTAQIDKQTTAKNAIADKLKAATDEADETRAIIKDIQSEIARLQGIMSGAIEVDPTEFMKIPEQLERAKAELKVNEDLYKKQEQAVTKLEGEQAKVNQKIEDGTAALSEMQTQAGGLARSIESQRPFDNIAASVEDAKGKLLKFVKYAVGIRSVYVLFRKLRSAIKDAVMAFAAQDKETQATVNSLKASLETLKLSWGAAFAPILNAVAPLLQTLINWLTQAANAVARFIAIVSGRSTYKKAVANNNALSSSLKGVGSAAKEAKKQVMDFDDLNILQDTSSSGSGGGSSAAQLVEEATDALDGSFLSNLALSVKDVFFTWDDLNPEQIAEKIITGLSGVLGLALGITLGLSPGGVIALTIGGLLLGLVANALIFDHDGQISTSEILSMLLMVMGALAGGVIGFAMGGVPGMIIMSLVGGTVAAGISKLIFGSEGQMNKRQLLNMLIIALGGIVGGVIGFSIGGIPGALIGATIGMVLSLAVTKFIGGEEAGETLGDKIILGLEDIGTKLTDWWDTKVKPWFSAEKWQQLGQDAMQSIKNGLNSIKLPKFHFSWGKAQYNYNFFGKTGTVMIPYPSIDWYARGGVFSNASIIGVGESGKEAVVPLERNTEWITLVADGLIDRILNNNNLDRLAAAFTATPLPAMAGAVVPPNSLSRTDNSDLQAIRDTLADLRTLLSGRGEDSGTRDFRLYLDGREIYTTVKQYERQDRRSGGW